jgi:hypothetical protein
VMGARIGLHLGVDPVGLHRLGKGGDSLGRRPDILTGAGIVELCPGQAGRPNCFSMRSWTYYEADHKLKTVRLGRHAGLDGDTTA